MAFHLILLVLSIVLLFLAGLFSWPRSNPPTPSYGHALGWFGLAVFVLSAIVP